MATSSILGGTKLPDEVGGKDIRTLGPSDTSDTGSDAAGAYGSDELASDSDAEGTGERPSVGPTRGEENADILPDHVESIDDADGFAGDDEMDPDDLGDDDDLDDDLDDIADLEDVDFDDDESSRVR